MDGHSLLLIIQKKRHTLIEVNASQNDKDFIAAINWKKAEEYMQSWKIKTDSSRICS